MKTTAAMRCKRLSAADSLLCTDKYAICFPSAGFGPANSPSKRVKAANEERKTKQKQILDMHHIHLNRPIPINKRKKYVHGKYKLCVQLQMGLHCASGKVISRRKVNK